MADDPIASLAELKLIKDSAELEAEISSLAPGWFVHVYRRLRGEAAEALAALALVDREYEAKEFREFQARVRAYDIFMREVRSFINEGVNADQQMTEKERQEVLDILMDQGPDGQSVAVDLGLIDEPPGSGGA
jgi:hypothetical protein